MGRIRPLRGADASPPMRGRIVFKVSGGR